MSYLYKILELLRPKKITYCNIIQKEPDKLLEGKNIVITGGSSGIGKAIAVKSVLEGANVVIIGRNENKLEKAAKEIGSNVKYLVSDVLNDNLINNAESLLGGLITNVVNNAGVYIVREENYTIEDFNKTIDTNLKAPFFITQKYIQYCKKNDVQGNILMTSSNRGMMGDITPYGVSKAGLINCVQGFARENTEYGIRINAICPGMTGSDINGISKADNLYENGCRGKRVLIAEEIAEIACFMMSDVSNCINGAVIPCDQGDYLR